MPNNIDKDLYLGLCRIKPMYFKKGNIQSIQFINILVKEYESNNEYDNIQRDVIKILIERANKR